MAIVLRLPLGLRIRHKVAAAGRRALDIVYSPVISRLTVDEYLGCSTRNECLRAYLRRRLG